MEREMYKAIALRAVYIADSLHKQTVVRDQKIDSLSRSLKAVRNRPLPEKTYSVRELELLFEEWYYRDVEENEDY
jgi:hypothetical protein